MLRIFHISEQKEKASDARRRFFSVAVATVKVLQRSQVMLSLFALWVL